MADEFVKDSMSEESDPEPGKEIWGSDIEGEARETVKGDWEERSW